MDIKTWEPQKISETTDFELFKFPESIVPSPDNVMHCLQRLVDLGHVPVAASNFNVICYKTEGADK